MESRTIQLPVIPAGRLFQDKLEEHRLTLRPVSVETMQINITKLCNQACRHCHVDSSPKRTEQMDRRTVDRCLEILSEHQEIKILDITGGAPELNPHFDYLVGEAVRLGKRVMVRHNLTVQEDGHPVTGESKAYLPDFFAQHEVEVISSLPFYEPYFTDRQRGKGVFEKSVEALRRLNEKGYGQEGTGLTLNLVYNPVGTYLPPSQAALEADYKRSLKDKYGISFNHLYTITNMPIHRFREDLERNDKYTDYMEKLSAAFNPVAAEGVMCRSLISVSYDGRIYDCDFNQMLGLQARNGELFTVWNFSLKKLKEREILFESHCLGCTAGGGSSCGGATV